MQDVCMFGAVTKSQLDMKTPDNVITRKEWQTWCRLCANGINDKNVRFVYEYNDQEQTYMETNLLADIKKYVWIDIPQNESLSNKVCGDCYDTIKTYMQFTERVKKVQEFYSELIKLPNIAANQLQDFRRQFEFNANIKASALKAEHNSKEKSFVIKSQDNYKGHLKECEQKQDKCDKIEQLFNCDYCAKNFKTKSSREYHIKSIHMKPSLYICEQCGVSVRTNGALKEHMLTHTDYAPYQCKVCDKSFKHHTRLKNHMETHDPNKHICAKCGLQLNSRFTLNRHLLVHSDELTHKCDYCGRAFKRAKTLKNHLLLHTGLKPYSCDFCDRTFANGSNCRSHKKKAHPKELAALEAQGGVPTYTKNIPKLSALKAVTKTANNLTPVVTKQSGRFAFGKKQKNPVIQTTAKPLEQADDNQQQQLEHVYNRFVFEAAAAAAAATETHKLNTDGGVKFSTFYYAKP